MHCKDIWARKNVEIDSRELLSGPGLTAYPMSLLSFCHIQLVAALLVGKSSLGVGAAEPLHTWKATPVRVFAVHGSQQHLLVLWRKIKQTSVPTTSSVSSETNPTQSKGSRPMASGAAFSTACAELALPSGTKNRLPCQKRIAIR